MSAGHFEQAIAQKATTIAAVASAFAALAWVLLAWRTPTSTFHFAPIVVVLAGPLLGRQQQDRYDVATATPIVMTGSLVFAIALITLIVGDKLRGPTFWSDDRAVVEAIAFGLIATLGGFGLLTLSGHQPIEESTDQDQ